MENNITGWMKRLHLLSARADEAACIMAQPVAWSKLTDRDPITTWAEGRQCVVIHLRALAGLANEIAGLAEALPALTADNPAAATKATNQEADNGQ